MKRLYSCFFVVIRLTNFVRFFLLLVLLSLYSSNLLVGQTIDLSKPVGSPEGNVGANASGGINYTIPIKVLPGINDLQPNLSLNYNSAGGAGDFGFGWSLSGSSSINRAGKSNYYNGIAKPVSYTNTDDAFVLDGQRLFVKTGNNGANGATYGTEHETFAKIESFGGSEVGGPDWFRVTTKDGNVKEYGSVANTKYLTDNGQSTMVWLLYKITDKNGNYEIFKYNLDNTNRYFPVVEIDYAGNATSGIQPMNKVLFTYTFKADWQTQEKFESGASYGTPFLLNNISVVNSAGTTVKSYEPTYTILKKQNFLTSFTEKGADGTSLNPLKFTYGSNTTAADVNISPSYGQFNYNNTFTGDVTGDGKDDVVAAYLYYDNNGIPHYNSYYVFDDFSTYNGQAAISIAYDYPMPDANNSTKADQVKSPGGYYNFLTSDYDGDTKKDILMANWTISGSNMIFNKITINYSRYYGAVQGPTYENKVYPNIPHSFQYTNDFKYAYNSGSIYGTNFIPGDFDGDGAMDYILVLGINPSNSFKAFFSSPSKGIINEEIANFGVEGTSTDPFYATSVASATDVVPVDFDGDGKTEILVQKANQSYILSVFPISATSGYLYAASTLYTTTAIKTGYRVFPGDFNGDGATDLLVRNSKTDPNAAWNLLYSTGKTFKSYPFIFTHRPYLDGDAGGYSEVNMVMVGDFNGDGRSDVWNSRDEASGGLHSEHIAFYSNGIPLDGQNSTTAFTIETYTRPESVNKSVNTQSIVGDINGDSKEDLMSLLNTRSLIIYPRPFKEDHLMASTTDGYGGLTTFNYELMNNGYNYQRSYYYYYDEYGAPIGQSQNGNPYNVINTPAYVLTQMATPNGIGGSAYTTYNYQDAVFSPIRGFLGFKQIKETDNAGISKLTISDINSTLLIPHTIRQIKSYGIDTLSDYRITDTLRRLSTSYFDKRYVHEINKTITINGLTGAAVESANIYDNYANVINNTTKKGYMSGASVTPIETAITTVVYGTHGTPVPMMPESANIKNTRSGQAQVSKTTTYTYDTKGNLLTSTNFSGTAMAVTTTNTYDNFGNIKTIIISAPGTPTPAVTNTYENTGRFLIKKQSSGSGITKTEIYTYDPKWGEIATSVSTDGLTTSYLYGDGYGRLLKTTYPDGNSITQALTWETSGNSRYSVTSQRLADGGMFSKDYYDLLSRKIKSEKGGFNNQLLTTVINYDYQGRISSQTEPYYSNETPVTMTNTFDSYGRPTGSANGTNSISIAYSKIADGKYKTTATNGAGQANSKTQDAAGRIINSNDNGGQLNITYDSWGNQKSVVLGSNTIVSSVYDGYGRRASMTDKNAGTISYQYNALGRIIKQTDALSHIYTVAYDAFGRIITHTGPEGSVSYVYCNNVTSGGNNDNVANINGFAGDVTNYIYDNLGRPISKSVVFDGITFTETYAYDIYGNVVKTTYPSGEAIDATYDKNGILTKKTMGAGPAKFILFSATTMNSKGIYTGYSYGNGKASTVTYDLAKNAPSRYYTAGIQDLNMTFDGSTGNLILRKDNIKNLTETFTFDNLNRLTGSKVNNIQQFTMTYDNTGGTSMGNIATKSDVGKYIYDGNKINAVKYVTSIVGGQTPPSVISQMTQDISYTAFLKADTITENGYKLEYSYGQDYQRIKSVLRQGATVLETKYYLGSFERLIKGGVTKDIHYIHAGNRICAITVRQNPIGSTYFVYSDHLGSLLTLTDRNGNIVSQQNFDAWGRNRNPDTWNYANVPPAPDWLYRGFTGHEHLNEFSLINMNGRVYDPTIGRMISPDNYVQMPWNTQSYNRYSYCINNPVKYSDKSGELFGIDDFVIGFFKGLVTGKPPFKTGWEQAKNSIKIWGGLFTGNFGQTLSRLTWQLPQTIIGLTTDLTLNTITLVNNVDYYDGATAVTTNTGVWGGFTLSSFITGDETLEASPYNELFQHEYGHYLQSQKSGPLYLFKYAIPSLVLTNFSSAEASHHLWMEQDANRRARAYWQKQIPGFIAWNNASNPIDSDSEIKNPNWWEWPLYPFSSLISGLFN